MVRKKSSKKKVSYNNKKIVLGIIVLVILFVLAFAYQDSRDDEEGLGNIFDRGNEKRDDRRDDRRESKEMDHTEEKDFEEDEEKKSNVCCYIRCHNKKHNKKIPFYDFKVLNLEREECNKKSIENNPDLESFLNECKTIKKGGQKKEKLGKKDWDFWIYKEIDEGGICEDVEGDKENDNQCIGREIITAKTKYIISNPKPYGFSNKQGTFKLMGARYPKINISTNCSKNDIDISTIARDAFNYAVTHDCWENAKDKSELRCGEGCTNIFSLEHENSEDINIISVDWDTINSQHNIEWGKVVPCWTIPGQAGKHCCVVINKCLVINKCVKNRESPSNTPEGNPEDDPEI